MFTQHLSNISWGDKYICVYFNLFDTYQKKMLHKQNRNILIEFSKYIYVVSGFGYEAVIFPVLH